MKKTIIICGSIAGFICTSWFLVSMVIYNTEIDFEHGEIYGYTAMLLAFSLIFVGIKNFRDKYNDGQVTFGKAFKIGFYISLIASTIYVLTWLVDYYCFIPDFMDKYTTHILEKMKTDGATAVMINDKLKDMDKIKELYKNPLFVILMTYAEILPLGLLISLVSAAILKRKNKIHSEVL